MKQYQWMRLSLISGGMAVVMAAASGCSLLSTTTSQEIDPPQTIADPVMGKEVPSAPLEGGTELTVFLKDPNGYIAPVTLQTVLKPDERVEKRALEMMVENGAYAAELPEGFQPILPQGTEVETFNVIQEQHKAIVDFSSPFLDYNLPDERKIVEALTWTLTGFPNIDQVEIWNEGERLDEMPVDGLPLTGPLSRKMGINLEKAEGVDYARSMPVTLYFSAVSEEDEQYYVPVTRLIERSSDPAKAAMEQLIAGPGPFSKLHAVITEDIEVNELGIAGEVVTVDLKDELYKDDQKLPSEMLQAVVLSLTENTGAKQVKIQFNGTSNVKDTDNRSYNEPVNRPEHVNALKF
ncbi:GerMN domain-containing protein [Paenibacillus daejeonensis]|uniref:GerMN domain-containing protein n=1 Tax=Paenibacillus daejeonensis TaxID=135193 RepID=UPI00036A61C8|nr:GerMN domain-containing protein [Paenibacillus daejeonensis]